MSHPRSLGEQQAIAAEQWYRDYERVGTFQAKASELGVTPDTLRDAIRRVRGQLTKNSREKLSAHDMESLLAELSTNAFPVERRQSEEEQSEKADSV